MTPCPSLITSTLFAVDGVDAETSLSFFLSLFMSTSLLRLFSCAHYWVNKYILFAAKLAERLERLDGRFVC